MAAGPSEKGSPQWWDAYYKNASDEASRPAALQATILELVRDKSYVDAELAVKKYLQYQTKQAEPWMYEWLVKLMELRKESPDTIRATISYAAKLAKRTMKPEDLIRVADMMVLRDLYGTIGAPGFQTSIGELVDLAGDRAPAEFVPPMMSVNLARKTRDPVRMADAAERLLALGWRGRDDRIRRDLREQVDLLAKSLRDDARGGEADALLSKVEASEARDVFIRLSWTGEADIDLQVDEPLGATAQYSMPRTVFGGAIIKNGYGSHPEEVYVCPRAFPGDYKAHVVVVYNDEANPVKAAKLELILHEGAPDEKREVRTIDLTHPEAVTVTLAGGRRKTVLPFLAPPRRPDVAEKPREKAKPADPSVLRPPAAAANRGVAKPANGTNNN